MENSQTIHQRKFKRSELRKHIEELVEKQTNEIFISAQLSVAYVEEFEEIPPIEPEEIEELSDETIRKIKSLQKKLSRIIEDEVIGASEEGACIEDI